MTGYRDTAWLRDAHDRAECPDLCPHCQQIENHEPPERGARDLLTVEDYEDAP